MKENIFKESKLHALTEDFASIISQWEYDIPYDVYNFKGHPNGYQFDSSTWGTEQFCLYDENTVLGQVACQFDGDNLWIGWSLNPDLCGKGNGCEFISKCVLEIRKLKNFNGSILLRVSATNKRAIKAYQKAGFVHIQTIKDEIPYTKHIEDFWVMKLNDQLN